jgi:hypothetical protein
LLSLRAYTAGVIHIHTDASFHRYFDLLAWTSGAIGGWAVSRWRLGDARSVLPQSLGYWLCLALGAIAGAYLAGPLPLILRGQVSISHSIAGALAGAIVGVECYKLCAGIKQSTGGVFVPAFAIGIIVGRWGCLFAGLPDYTYGTPTNLPWGVDLGDGIARHPVQIYESLSMLAFLCVYLLALERRDPWAMREGFYWMTAWYGAQRFLWEFLKPYPTILGPLNPFHIICVGLVIYGCIGIARSRRLAAATA